MERPPCGRVITGGRARFAGPSPDLRFAPSGYGAIPFSVALPPTCEDAIGTAPSAQGQKKFLSSV